MSHENPSQRPNQDPNLVNPDALERQTLQQMAAEVTPILALDAETGAEAFHDFVPERIAQLPTHDPNRPIGVNYGGTDEFIGPDTQMVLASLFDKPYHMDDNTMYDTAFSLVREFHGRFQGKASEEKVYLKSVVEGVNVAQAEYFGSVTGNAARREAVTADLLGDDDEEESEVSIADFGTSAQCQERAGVAHNMLQVFGVESELVAGDLQSEAPDGTVSAEPHAFLVITGSEGQRFIFDPTNPIVYRGEDGRVESIKAALYPLNPDEQGRQQVSLAEFTSSGANAEQTKTTMLTYSFERQLAAA